MLIVAVAETRCNQWHFSVVIVPKCHKITSFIFLLFKHAEVIITDYMLSIAVVQLPFNLFLTDIVRQMDATASITHFINSDGPLFARDTITNRFLFGLNILTNLGKEQKALDEGCMSVDYIEYCFT